MPASTARGRSRGRAAGPRGAAPPPPAARGVPRAGHCSAASSPPCPRTVGTRAGHAVSAPTSQGPPHPAKPAGERRGPSRKPGAPAALPTHLLARVDGAPAALRGSEAEAAGAAFGVGSVQGEGPQAALVTSRALNILLGQEARARPFNRLGSPSTPCQRALSQSVWGARPAPRGCPAVDEAGRGGAGRRPWFPLASCPHLAVTLAREGVTHAWRRASLVAVTGAAAGVAVEARSTGVTAAPGHVGSAPARGVQKRTGPPLCQDPSRRSERRQAIPSPQN